MFPKEPVLIESQIESELRRPPQSEGRASHGLLTLVLIVVIVMTMFLKYGQSGQLVTLKVNGNQWQTRTHQRTVAAFLREVGLELQPADIVLPPLDTLLVADQTVIVQKALPVLVEADGQMVEHYTHSRCMEDLLHELALNPKPYDVLTLGGNPVSPDAPLPKFEWAPSRWPLFRSLARSLRATLPRADGAKTRETSLRTQQSAGTPDNSSTFWVRVKLQRAVPLSINDGGTYTTIYTIARTVGEALLSQDIVLYLGDRVQPLLGTLLTAGMHVEIQRAKPVALQVDGRVIKTRTQARNVAQLLSEVGIPLLGRDYTIPKLDTEVAQDMSVRIVRVVDDWILEAEEISYETIWRADSNLELDQHRTDQPGKVGVRKRSVHIVYEDGEEKERIVVDEWVERQPTTRIVSYGTQIVVRELETPNGVIRYWRKIRMLATSYRASGVGKDPAHPEYGITRLGWKAGKGIVAVDPRVINLRTNVYVPGYGFGVAADTGGRIKGRRIDLCYDEDNWVPWKQWVDVYLLEPVPPAGEINWVLLSYPTES